MGKDLFKGLEGFETYTLGKTNYKVKMEEQGEYLVGYVDNQRFYVTNTPEQVSAFVMKYQYKNVMLTDLLDIRLLETAMGFIQFCADQEYLSAKLLPVLVPMQRGEVEATKFTPHQIATDDNYMIDGIRLKSGGGHYLGTLIFDNGYPEPYSRETDYYATEKKVQEDFPESISWDDALEKAKEKGWIN